MYLCFPYQFYQVFQIVYTVPTLKHDIDTKAEIKRVLLLDCIPSTFEHASEVMMTACDAAAHALHAHSSALLLPVGWP